MDFKDITEQREAAKKAYHYAKRNKSIFILNPDSGIGKTRLAVAAFKLSWQYDTYIEKNCFDEVVHAAQRRDPENSLFVPIWKVGVELDQAYFRLEDKMRKLFRARRLLLDELTTEPEGARQSIENLIRHFSDYNKQIIATIPMTLKDFEGYYNGCITRRMSDNGVFIELEGEQFKEK